MDCSAAFQIPPPRLRSATGIQRRQAADIVVIIHFSPFLSSLSFLHPPPSTHLHFTLTTTLTLAQSLLIIVHQKQGPIAPLTPTCTRNHLPLHHRLHTSLNKNFN